MFIRPIPEDDAPPAVAQIYARDRELWSFLPNFTRAFSLHPKARRRPAGQPAAVAASMNPCSFTPVPRTPGISAPS